MYPLSPHPLRSGSGGSTGGAWGGGLHDPLSSIRPRARSQQGWDEGSLNQHSHRTQSCPPVNRGRASSDPLSETCSPTVGATDDAGDGGRGEGGDSDGASGDGDGDSKPVAMLAAMHWLK
jgi:hypothetical protein